MSTAAIAQLLGSLIAVVLVILLMAWLARRLPIAGAARNDLLKVKASVAVGHRERVVLLQAGEEWLVLGVAQGQVRPLHVLKQAPAEFSRVLADQGQD